MAGPTRNDGGPIASLRAPTHQVSGGYVYILINWSMPGLIKVGRTLRDSQARARELSSPTGVPSRFEVAFEVFSENYERLEEEVHRELVDFRESDNREFFRYPLKRAIQLLYRLNGPATHPEAEFAAEDVTVRLREKYPSFIDAEIVAIRIVQVPGRVWLEVTRETTVAGYLRDQEIKRTDLAFITGDEAPLFFSPTATVQTNARKLVEQFDAYSIATTTDLFHENGRREVSAQLSPTNVVNGWRSRTSGAPEPK